MSFRFGAMPDSEPPSKRRRTLPATSAHAASTPIKPRTSYSFPYTPSSPTSPFSSPYPYHADPQDSPSNPFGRKRTISLMSELPDETRFSQHIALRFQFTRKGDKPTRKAEGVYRIAQVPKSYTLLHLRYLISFLFASGSKRAKGYTHDDGGIPAHLFELKKKVELYSEDYRVGVIKKGETYVRASNVSNPYTYKEDLVDLDDDDPFVEEENDAASGSSTPQDAHAEWTWVSEEDLTIENVWPELDQTRGIVFHQLSGSDKIPPAQIHITINSRKTERRIGRGNAPYVFFAEGRVSLIHAATRSFVQRSELSDDDDDADGDTDDEEVGKEDYSVELSPNDWNKPEDAFARYLKSNSVVSFEDVFEDSSHRSSQGWHSSSPSQTPELTSSYSIVSSQAFSSPIRSSFSSRPSVQVASSSASSPITSRPFMFGKAPKNTPAPLPAQRKRLDYIRARLERSKQRMSDKVKAKAREKKQAKMKELQQQQLKEARAKSKSKSKPLALVKPSVSSEEEEDEIATGVDDSPLKNKRKRPRVEYEQDSPYL